MIYDRLRVFVSSRMEELAPEREAIRRALEELHMDGWVFERDAGARVGSIQDTYRQELESADLYVGLFWLDYGDYTMDEFELATAMAKDRLIYEKRLDIEGRRDPQLQAFLDRIGEVETGLTVQWFDTPEELGEAVKRDTARWQSGKVRALRKLNDTRREYPVEDSEQRGLSTLAEKVSQFWIHGVLERCMEGEGLVELARDRRSDAVANPWEAVLALPFEGSRSISPEKTILDVFEELQGSMLVLGQPGSGKTTTMLLLLRELLGRWRHGLQQPTPVVFNLSSWTDPRQPLPAWLEDELNAKYQIPKTLAKPWLEHNRLVLMLDGLDELAAERRPACVEAINYYAREIGLPGLVVCCRAEQYDELPVKLSLNGAILLRPLSDEQIHAYVNDAGPELSGLRSALEKDEVLHEFARSPLMLNLMCLAYRGYAAVDLVSSETEEQHTRHLFSTYIDRMFSRRGTAKLAYSREQTLSWMSWIADRLSRDSQTMMLIESLQPSWLARRGQRAVYLVATALLLGLLVGAVNALYWSVPVLPSNVAGETGGLDLAWLWSMPLWLLSYGWVETLGKGSGPPFLERVPAGGWRAAAIGCVAVVLLVPVAILANAFVDPAFEHGNRFAVSMLWAGIPIISLLAAKGARGSVFHRIATVESLGWTAANAGKGTLLGLLAGLAVGAFCRAAVSLADLDYPSAKMVILVLGFTTVGACLGALLGGMTARIHRGKTVANQGMRLTLRTALKMGLHAIWLVGIVFAFYVWSVAGKMPEFAVAAQLVAGWFFALALALFLWFGGFETLKHYVLRGVIAATGLGPWDLPRLLDHARDLSLMRRAGSGYIFLHRRLMEFLRGIDGRPGAR